MDYGLVTYDNTGQTNFSSIVASSNYFDTSINASTNTSLGSVQFQSAGAVYTPTAASSWRYVMYDSSKADRFWFTVPGCVNAGGTQFYAPSVKYINAHPSYRTLRVEANVNCNIKRFGKLAGSADTGYGFTTQAPDGTLAVSNTYQAFYVHPDASQSKLRTATAVSLPTATYGQGGGNQTTLYQQNRPQNITFDEPYDTPPLIFVTQSSGLIAFNGMIQDANGKFIGASICAAPGLAQWYAPGFSYYIPYSPITATSFTFTYFLVHQKAPVNSVASSHGLEVYNASGELTFSSKHFVPAITKYSIALPYVWLIAASSSPSNWKYENAATIAKTANQGVCINSFFSFTGCITEACENSSIPPGPISVAGRYINVGATSVTATGALTNCQWQFFGALSPVSPQSADFHLNDISTMDVFLANYAY